MFGYEGTFKSWQGCDVGELPDDAVLDLWGDGPLRDDVVSAARRRGIDVRVHGWGTPDRSSWDVAWCPRGPWPPSPVTFPGAAPPARYFSPLKEAAAAAAGLPVWYDGALHALPPPPSWTDVARTILASAGVERARLAAAE